MDYFFSNLRNEKRPIFTNKEKTISCEDKCAKLNQKKVFERINTENIASCLMY
tara:strand:- start:92 stop:250 length:159 start_codon:yes stop_codon:yes gene_type:complete